MVTQKVSIVSRLNMVMIIDNKARIKEKARDLFLQLGMRRVSMDDIANAVGMSKKTLYQYYPDKETLVADTIEMILKANNAYCENSRKQAENAIHESFLATDAVAETMKRMNPVLIFDMQKYYPAAYKKFEIFRKEYLYNFIRSSIEAGIKQGLYKEDINLNFISRFRIETISLSFLQKFSQDINMDLATIQQELFLFFLYGLATPKGIKLINKYKNQRLKPHTDENK